VGARDAASTTGRPAGELGRALVLQSPEDRLAHGLARRLALGSPLSGGAALIQFDAGYAAWNVRIDGTEMALLPGRVAGADAVVQGDATTLAAIADGEESGIHAFLAGRVTIRGNLALALRLDGVDTPGRPVHFPRARSVRACDIETFYLDAGTGPAAVLLHGLGATNASMLPTLAALAPSHRVLAPDLPGFGDSEKPVRVYDPAFYARWLVALLDALGIERAVLVGNSMGGRVAIETALLAPERVDRLVLFAPSMAFRRFREATWLVRLLAAELGALPMLVPRALVLRALSGMFAEPGMMREAWYEAAIDEFLRVFATPRGRMAFFSAARQIYLEEAYGEEGFWDRLPALSRPALFLWGDRDQLVPCGFARHVTDALPSVCSIVLENCGHVPQFEHPELTHRLTREFLGVRHADGRR
jgi:pimeloyl-ACP methyl ester carboxylesterase